MIRRLFILVGSIIGLALLTCLLSEVWQFGYVSPSHSVGLRGGTLWHISRSAPMPDPDGLYIDHADAVNRAMRTINSQARWTHHLIWDPILTSSALLMYALLVLASRRFVKRPLPRPLIASLAAMSVFLAIAWIPSHFSTISFDSSKGYFRLADGSATVYVDRRGTMTQYLSGTGWSIHTGMSGFATSGFTMHSSGLLNVSDNAIIANIPLGILCVVFGVPAIAFARWNPTRWIGHCPRCRYDLTGNVTGTCPECGTVVPKKEALPV